MGPERALRLRSEEEGPRLLRHESQLKRPYYVKRLLRALESGLLFGKLRYESACQRVHQEVVAVILGLVAVELVAY